MLNTNPSSLPVSPHGLVGFNAKKYERPGFTEEEIKEIKDAFDIFDVDGGGEIDPNELQSAMASMGFQVDTELIKLMVMSADKQNNDGKINFEEFLDMMTVSQQDLKSRENIEEVFNLFDHDGNGTLSLENLKKICKNVGEIIDESELLEMLKRADFDKDDKVNFEDFYQIMTYKSKIQ